LACYPLCHTLLSRQRELSQYSSVDFSALISILYTFIALFTVLNTLIRKENSYIAKIIFTTNLKWFLYFSLWGLVTIFWTVNVPLTGYRSFECISIFLLIIIVISTLITKYNPEIAVQWVLKWLVMFELLMQVLLLVRWGVRDAFIFHASQMSITVFFFLVLFHSRSTLIKIVASVFSIFSGSTTSCIGLALGCFGQWMGDSKQKRIALLIGVITLFGIFTIGTMDLLKRTVFIQRDEIGWEHMSGRDYLWTSAWIWGNQRPLGGWGFFAGEPYLLYQGSGGAINFHSSLLSAFVGTGYVGAVVLLIYILSYIPIFFHKNLLEKYRGALLGCYCVALCHCIANPGIGSRIYGSWKSVTILFVLISVIDYYNSSKEESGLVCASRG